MPALISEQILFFPLCGGSHLTADTACRMRDGMTERNSEHCQNIEIHNTQYPRLPGSSSDPAGAEGTPVACGAGPPCGDRKLGSKFGGCGAGPANHGRIRRCGTRQCLCTCMYIPTCTRYCRWHGMEHTEKRQQHRQTLWAGVDAVS
jgi:hypothetical protein